MGKGRRDKWERGGRMRERRGKGRRHKKRWEGKMGGGGWIRREDK